MPRSQQQQQPQRTIQPLTVEALYTYDTIRYDTILPNSTKPTHAPSCFDTKHRLFEASRCFALCYAAAVNRLRCQDGHVRTYVRNQETKHQEQEQQRQHKDTPYLSLYINNSRPFRTEYCWVSSLVSLLFLFLFTSYYYYYYFSSDTPYHTIQYHTSYGEGQAQNTDN